MFTWTVSIVVLFRDLTWPKINFAGSDENVWIALLLSWNTDGAEEIW